MTGTWDVIVVGAGHAGCEAALAAGRMGCTVLVVTGNLGTIGAMACNCSLGGPAKAHLVREIDALGGEMGRNADRTFTHMRMLNTRKGPAVQALRAQADKARYRSSMKRALESGERVCLLQETVIGLRAEGAGGLVVLTQEGERLRGRRVILATGTFLNGVIHIGEASYQGGRAGEPPSVGLGESLIELGLPISRLKTGTVPRVSRRSIQVDGLTRSPSDPRDLRFSFERVPRPPLPLLPCWRTSTTAATVQVVGDAMHRSALGSGRITGKGPRYCPSIEARLLRFPDRSEHGVFLELEGWGTDEVYVQGTSNSLPVDVQRSMVRTIPGLERAELMRPGYAIEYDYVRSGALTPQLSCCAIPALYLAGQINGSSGYEEAAAQGLVAGANAASDLRGQPPLPLTRSTSYIGVLIDDLVHHHGDEPYRLLTARAEHRLSLGQDTAYSRLTETAWEYGLVPLSRREAVLEALEQAESESLGRRYHSLARHMVEDRNIYGGYRRQAETRETPPESFRNLRLPVDLDFARLPLKLESRERLSAARPNTISEAARVPGVTPADVATLFAFVAGRRRIVSRETLQETDEGDG